MIYNEEIILECLDIQDESFDIKQSDDLDSIGWDSLSAINLLTIFSQKFNTEIDPDDLEALKTVEDLDLYLKNLLDA